MTGAEPAGAWGALPRCVARGILAAVALWTAGCGDGPIAPDDDLLIEVAGPPLQLAPPSAPAPDPLRVVVRRRSDLAPVRELEVSWAAIEGEGLVLSAPTSRTDSAGMASVEVVLGERKGRYRVRARGPNASAEFELWVVDAPVVESMPSRARPGDTVRIVGRNFSPVGEHDLVRFGGARAKVARATTTELQVEVPPCLPAGATSVRVWLGDQASAPVSTLIEQPRAAEPLAVGGSVVLDGGSAGKESCRRLDPGSYLLVLAATGSVLGASRAAAVRLLDGESAARPIRLPEERVGTGTASEGRQARWDAALRALEDRWIREGPDAGGLLAPVAAAPPRVGDRREFTVRQSGGGFRRVTAVVRRVSADAAFYEDVETPPGQLSELDYVGFGAALDDPIAPTVTRVFGDPSDLDGNGRFIVLFTPAVNRLTERGAKDGFIGGFFHGLDLLPSRVGSNGGEILYALVPDPEGRFGDPRSRDLVLSTVPTILAHELLHMVHFAERVISFGAPAGETLWLSEGLAGMAEDLVADAYLARGQRETAGAFQAGNYERARQFLANPDRTSLLTGAGVGTLAERGASWLFVRYLTEHHGGEGLLRALTRSRRSGIENVAAASERDWRDLVLEWGTAVYDGGEPGLADPGLADPRNRYASFRPRLTLTAPGRDYPLRVQWMEAGEEVAVDLLDGASLHLAVSALGPISIAVGGADGGPPLAGSGISLRILRLE